MATSLYGTAMDTSLDGDLVVCVCVSLDGGVRVCGWVMVIVYNVKLTPIQPFLILSRTRVKSHSTFSCPPSGGQLCFGASRRLSLLL